MNGKVRQLSVAPKTTWAESELSAEVRRVVATEIRMAGLVADPRPVLQLPWDGAAEQQLIALLVDGHKTPADLRPLRAEHFYASIYMMIFEAAEAVAEREGFDEPAAGGATARSPAAAFAAAALAGQARRPVARLEWRTKARRP